VFSAALHPGCAADHGYAPAPATLGFGVQPLRGKESDRSTSDDALDEESLTALMGTPARLTKVSGVSFQLACFLGKLEAYPTRTEVLSGVPLLPV